jgi:hypothetical protein
LAGYQKYLFLLCQGLIALANLFNQAAHAGWVERVGQRCSSSRESSETQPTFYSPPVFPVRANSSVDFASNSDMMIMTLSVVIVII